jgi:hypothetical protein
MLPVGAFRFHAAAQTRPRMTVCGQASDKAGHRIARIGVFGRFFAISPRLRRGRRGVAGDSAAASAAYVFIAAMPFDP